MTKNPRVRSKCIIVGSGVITQLVYGITQKTTANSIPKYSLY